MRKKEIIGCSCAQCRRGLHCNGFQQRAAQRSLRQRVKVVLKQGAEYIDNLISRGYTD